MWNKRTRKLAAAAGVVAFCAWSAGTASSQEPKGIRVVPDQANRRVDITIDGAPFTSYIWPTSLKKPVLFPLTAPGGIVVTRGFPLAPVPGERIDHPHHAGVWFNYGNVNGFDFWNNSDAIPAPDRGKMGTIYLKKIVSAKSGLNRGELTTESVWVAGSGQEILDQTTRYDFMRRNDARIVDQTTTLRALERAVFHDDKEGLFGIRVARWLESPDEKGGSFTDASGRKTQVASGAAAGANGVYLTSEGKRGEQAWGTRGRWCMLTGKDGSRVVAIAILDHPGNPGYPAYWHARGYGLFAVNPLGAKIFHPDGPAMNFTLEKNRSATFRYRVILFSHAATADEINREADAFAASAR